MNEDFPLKVDRNELAFLGPGIPLYLEFVILSTFTLLLLFFAFGIWGLWTNIYLSSNCIENKKEHDECSENIFNFISFTSKMNNSEMTMIQNEVCFITTLFLIFLLQYFRIIQQKTEKKCDDKLTSMSDYTLMVENLISSEGFDEIYLKETFEKIWNTIMKEGISDIKKESSWYENDDSIKTILESKFEIKKINQAFFIKEFIELERKKMKVKRKNRTNLWDLQKALMKFEDKKEKLENLSKKYCHMLLSYHSEISEQQTKNNFNEEVQNILKKRKKTRKISKILSKIERNSSDYKKVSEKMEKMVFEKKCPIVFITLNFQERTFGLKLGIIFI